VADSFLTRISGPTAPLLTTAEAKDHLRVDFADDDDLIDAYISAATDMVDAEWGELGRALVTQRWQLTLPAFPASGVIILPVPPVQQVTGITYYDADNAEQTLAADTYRLTVNGEDARLDKAAGAVWPATYNRVDAVAVQYDTGYGDAAADVPEGIPEAWTERHACRAQWVYGKGDESVQAAREAGRKAYKIRIRSCAAARAITEGYRMRDVRRSTVLNIREVDAITDRAWVYLTVEATLNTDT